MHICRAWRVSEARRHGYTSVVPAAGLHTEISNARSCQTCDPILPSPIYYFNSMTVNKLSQTTSGKKAVVLFSTGRQRVLISFPQSASMLSHLSPISVSRQRTLRFYIYISVWLFKARRLAETTTSLLQMTYISNRARVHDNRPMFRKWVNFEAPNTRLDNHPRRVCFAFLHPGVHRHKY